MSRRNQAQGKKWNLLKKDSAVFTVYHHNKEVIQTSTSKDLGCVFAIRSDEENDNKISFIYSGKRKLKLDLMYFAPCDDLSKILYSFISDKKKFTSKAKELYGIKLETVPSNNSSKRKEPMSPPTAPLPKRNRTSATVGEQERPTVVQAGVSTSESETSTHLTALSEEMLNFLISKDLVPVKVLVNSLKQPRSDYLLREIDDVFVKGLTKEFQENKALFVKPLTAIVTGVKSVEEFDVDSIDSYQLEVIGGNHRRAALQDLFKETKDEQFKWANVILFCEMPKAMVLKLAARHNRHDSFCHSMTTQDKVKLCQKIRINDFKGEKSGKWRSHCTDLLCTDKESLEFVFLLSGLDDDSFAVLLEVIKGFEQFQLKGQAPSTKYTANLVNGVTQKPNLTGSKFKCIRNLPNEFIKELLTSVQKQEISFKEMKERAEEWKSMNCLKNEFTKSAGLRSFKDVKERFPLWTSEEKLKQFVKEVKGGKAPEGFKSYIQRCLTCDSTSNIATVKTVTSPKGFSYSAKEAGDWKISSSLFEDIKFSGGDLILLQDVEEWTDDSVAMLTRAVTSINTRHKVTNYVIIIRKSVEKVCTGPDGTERNLYIVLPSTKIRAGSVPTKATEVFQMIIVGRPHIKCLDFIIAESEESLMTQLVQNFLPVHGTVIEIGSNKESLHLLNTAFKLKANMVGIYKDGSKTSQFLDKARQLTKVEEETE